MSGFAPNPPDARITPCRARTSTYSFFPPPSLFFPSAAEVDFLTTRTPVTTPFLSVRRFVTGEFVLKSTPNCMAFVTRTRT